MLSARAIDAATWGAHHLSLGPVWVGEWEAQAKNFSTYIDHMSVSMMGVRIENQPLATHHAPTGDSVTSAADGVLIHLLELLSSTA
jgi:hypothetical protein